jgi:putative ABC transport system ATP-binding protein
MIRLENVSKIYGQGEAQTAALNEASFEVEDGSFVVVLGPSGAGKSTLLNLLGGMDSATAGAIFIDDLDICALSELELTRFRAEKVGFIFQFYNLIPTLTAFENVDLMRMVKRDCLPAIEVLKQVGLGGHLNKFPSQLSGGEQQRVSIARAIVKCPQLLLCDEPTGALDSETGVHILKLLQDITRGCKDTDVPAEVTIDAAVKATVAVVSATPASATPASASPAIKPAKSANANPASDESAKPATPASASPAIKLTKSTSAESATPASTRPATPATPASATPASVQPASATPAAAKTTVVIVTHNAAIAQAADVVIRVRDGRVESITRVSKPRDINEVRW